jgi:hypothetical protein
LLHIFSTLQSSAAQSIGGHDDEVLGVAFLPPAFSSSSSSSSSSLAHSTHQSAHPLHLLTCGGDGRLRVFDIRRARDPLCAVDAADNDGSSSHHSPLGNQHGNQHGSQHRRLAGRLTCMATDGATVVVGAESGAVGAWKIDAPSSSSSSSSGMLRLLPAGVLADENGYGALTKITMVGARFCIFLHPLTVFSTSLCLSRAHASSLDVFVFACSGNSAVSSIAVSSDGGLLAAGFHCDANGLALFALP